MTTHGRSDEDKRRIIGALRDIAINKKLSMHHWNLYKPPGMPVAETLRHMFGMSWSRLLASVGLSVAPPGRRLDAQELNPNPKRDCECSEDTGGLPKPGVKWVECRVGRYASTQVGYWLCESCFEIWQEDEGRS